MPDQTGAIDVQIEEANDDLVARLLQVLALRAGAKLAVTAEDMRKLPPGSLGYLMEPEEEGGGIVLVWARMNLFAADKTTEKTEIAIVDSAFPTDYFASLRLALGCIVQTNGEDGNNAKMLYVERISAREIQVLGTTLLMRTPRIGGGFDFWVQ